MAATSIATSLLRRAVAVPVFRPRASLLNSSSRAYVVVARATKQASVAVSTKGSRFASSKVTAADENLKSVLNSEIETIEQSDYFKEIVCQHFCISLSIQSILDIVSGI
jgi:hypothetical protein